MSTQYTTSPNAATDTNLGVLRFATQAEVTAGALTDSAISPASLSAAMAYLVGGLVYRGVFDPTNPTNLSTAIRGDFYLISTAGSYQSISWEVGDHLLINEDMGGSVTSSKIDQMDNTAENYPATSTLFVDANRDYSGVTYSATGSIDRPFVTIAAALAAVQNTSINTTIFLQAGTYTHNTPDSTPWLGALSIVGVSRGEVTITAGSISSDCFYMQFKGGGLQFRSLTIDTAKYGIYTKTCNNVVVDDVRFVRCGSSGNVVDHDGLKNQTDQALVWSGANTSNGGAARIRAGVEIQVTNCFVEYCLRGLRIQDCVQGRITNNKTYRTLESGIYLAAGSYSGTDGCERVQIHSNIIEEAANNGILIVGGQGNTVVIMRSSQHGIAPYRSGMG